jgi:hypothetical protein
MARAWSLDGQHRNLRAEGGAGPPVPIKQRISSGGHAALCHHPDNFDSLHRKDDFLAEGVHTVSGVKDGEAQPQAFSFPADQVRPAEAKQWLQERGPEPVVFTEASEGRARAHTHPGSGRQGPQTERNGT